MTAIDRGVGASVARALARNQSPSDPAETHPDRFGSTQPIKILVASDQPIAREGLRGLLERQSDFRVVGEARDGREALFRVRDLQPDVMLLDFAAAIESWIGVMRDLRMAALRTRTIVVASEVARADTIELLQFGGRGIVLRDSSTELLFKCIRRVYQGEVWISRTTAAQVVEFLAARAPQHVLPEPQDEPEPIRVFSLTVREREILRLVVNGEPNKGVARRLSIGQDTVKHHLTSIFSKTGTSNRLELVLFALDHRLVKRN